MKPLQKKGEKVRLVDTPLHNHLKLIGIAYLHTQGCGPIVTELMVRYPMKKKDKNSYSADPLDIKGVVDVVGIQGKPLYERRETSYGVSRSTVGKRLISRGVEAKVTRTDFKNGYSATGCNYNYLITPSGMLKKHEYPKGMGILEYNKLKFSAELHSDFKFGFQGFKIIKRPTFVDTVSEEMVENLYSGTANNSNISTRQRSMIAKFTASELERVNVDETTRIQKYETFRLPDGRYSADVPWSRRSRVDSVRGIGYTPEDAIYNLLKNIRKRESNKVE